MIVSYGGHGGGRAAGQLREVLGGVRMRVGELVWFFSDFGFWGGGGCDWEACAVFLGAEGFCGDEMFVLLVGWSLDWWFVFRFLVSKRASFCWGAKSGDIACFGSRRVLRSSQNCLFT